MQGAEYARGGFQVLGAGTMFTGVAPDAVEVVVFTVLRCPPRAAVRQVASLSRAFR